MVTFAPLLEYQQFPLAQIVDDLLESGKLGRGGPVEIEFAVNLSQTETTGPEFALLQLRSMVLNQELESLNIEGIPPDPWFGSQEVFRLGKLFNHNWLKEPLNIKMNSYKNYGVICKSKTG